MSRYSGLIIEGEADSEGVAFSTERQYKGHCGRCSRVPVWLVALLAVCLLATVIAVAVVEHKRDTSSGVCSGAPDAITIIVSFDGFRHDYFKKTATPNFDRVKASGFHASAMRPVFPSKTFPNHYSIITGLYAETHGIVSNNIYDPTDGTYFHISDPKAVSASKWWLGEPAWVTAEKNGLTAGTIFWPGSEAIIEGRRPTHWLPFDDSVKGTARVDQAIEWACAGTDFLTMYFSDVDHAGHNYGPDSAEVVEAIGVVDASLGYLLDQLEANGLTGRTSLVLVSDHGMANMYPVKYVYVDDHVDMDLVRVPDYSPVLQLWPYDESLTDAIYTNMTKVPDPHWSVYRKHEIPEQYHYQHSVRIPPIIAVADESWTITRRSNPYPPLKGTHGFNNSLPDMGAIFLATGPRFKHAATPMPKVDNVNVYSLLCWCMGIPGAPNNGTIDPFLSYIKQAPPTP